MTTRAKRRLSLSIPLLFLLPPLGVPPIIVHDIGSCATSGQSGGPLKEKQSALYPQTE
jgi:hypothetical protein